MKLVNVYSTVSITNANKQTISTFTFKWAPQHGKHTHTQLERRKKESIVINQYACFVCPVLVLTPFYDSTKRLTSFSIRQKIILRAHTLPAPQYLVFSCFNVPNFDIVHIPTMFAQWPFSASEVGRNMQQEIRWMNEYRRKNIRKIQINQNWNDNRLACSDYVKNWPKNIIRSEPMNLFIQMSTYLPEHNFLFVMIDVCASTYKYSIHILHSMVNKLWIKYFVALGTFLQFRCCSPWFLWSWCWCFCFSDDIRKSSMDQFVMWIFDGISSRFLLFRFFLLP